VLLAGKAVALLGIFKTQACPEFSEEHMSFLGIITPFMGTLMENFRLHNEMLHKNSRLSALYEISQQAESLIDFRDVYEALGKVAKSFINFDAYLLYLLSSDGKHLDVRVSLGETDAFKKRIRVGEGPIGLAAQELKPYLTFTKTFNSVLILPIEVSGKLMGVVTIASSKAYAYRDEDIIGLRIIATQIASIDHMFKDLINLKGFTERILESMTSGVLILNHEGNVTFSNHEMRRLLATPIPEGWNPYSKDIQLPDQMQELLVEVLESNLTLENQKIKLKNFTPARIIEVNAFPFRSEAGGMLGTAFFFKDITEITAMEDQLKRADRLSALGVLAAGIAHEIRNPLTGMKMIVQLLESEFPEDDARIEPLGIIQKEIDRLEGIIGNLLDFARPSKPKAIKVCPEEVVNATLLLVKNQMHKQGVKFDKSVLENCPTIVGDPDQLKQVFLNILTNAIHALNKGGSLKVSIDHIGEFVSISFEDDGIGIPQEKIQDIFNPFMTTKEDGTGLGLSMAQRIVEEHGGKIEVHSVLGEGSKFEVFLPMGSEQDS
jgi:signal transduction histidine kinase